MSGHDRKGVLSLLSQEMRLDLKLEADPGLDFWKRRSSDEFRSRSVEPDLVITLSRSVKLIVEIKWGAPLSENELAAQWASLSRDERRSSAHLLLVRNKDQYADDIASDRSLLEGKDVGPEWPFVRTWTELAHALQKIAARSSSHVKEWAEKSAQLLMREEFRIMSGWSNLGFFSIDDVSWHFLASSSPAHALKIDWTPTYDDREQPEWRFKI
jgi:hypothetical protein